MLIVDESDRTEISGAAGPRPTVDLAGDGPGDTEEILRPGDGHLNGVESLCVGESQ